MIFRPFTLLCALAAAGAGWNLYQVKHRTALLDRELAGIADQIRASQKQKETMESIWGELNQLPRLRSLSQQLLPIETSQTPQNRSFAELDRRLPPAVPFDGQISAFAPRRTTSEPGQAVALLEPEPARPRTAVAAAAPIASPGAEPIRPAAPPAVASVVQPAEPTPASLPAPGLAVAPATLATAAAEPALAALADQPVEEEILPLPPPAPPMRPPMMALVEPRVVPAVVQRPVAAPAALPPVAAPVAPRPQPARTELPPVAHPAVVSAPVARPQPRPAAIAIAAPVAPEAPVRSMLGGAGGGFLAPPVPFGGTANAATYGGYGR